MAIPATALRGTSVEWSRSLLVGLLAAMTVAAMVLLPELEGAQLGQGEDPKHLFEHRYDYRTEWLRFTSTVGITGADVAPLGERVIKAFADILEAPGGLLLSRDPSGAIATASSWNWPGKHPPADGLDRSGSSGPRWNRTAGSLSSMVSATVGRARRIAFPCRRNGCSRSAAPGSECH